MKPRLVMLKGAWYCRSCHGGPMCFGLGRTPIEAYAMWRQTLAREREAARWLSWR